MATVTIPHNWKPRWYQRNLWRYLERGGRRAAAVWHRRAGKDDLALHWTCVAAHERVATYWHMLPQANQARKAIWEAVNPHTGKRRIDEAFPEELRATTREQEMFIKLKVGSTWQVVGSDNFEGLIGSPPVGIVYSEWAVADPRALGFLSPILLENNGWSLFIYTSRGRNHGYTTFRECQADPEAFAELLTVDQTDVFTPEQLVKERRRYHAEYGEDDGEAFFQQEYYCSFNAALLGSYFGKLMERADKEGRITKVPWEPQLPVYTAWDLGMDDSTAIWFLQPQGRQIRGIDYYEGSGVGLEHYVKMLRDKPYVYADDRGHFLPHDTNVQELGTGKTRLATLNDLGMRRGIKIVPKASPADAVNAVRTILPRMWFDATKCARGVEALINYRREYDEERKVFKDKPVHDWASHAVDSLRHFAMGWREEPSNPLATRQLQAIDDINPRGVFAEPRRIDARYFPDAVEE